MEVSLVFKAKDLNSLRNNLKAALAQLEADEIGVSNIDVGAVKAELKKNKAKADAETDFESQLEDALTEKSDDENAELDLEQFDAPISKKVASKKSTPARETTLKELSDALKAYSQRPGNSTKDVLKLLGSYKVKSIHDVPKDKYREILKKLDA